MSSFLISYAILSALLNLLIESEFDDRLNSVREAAALPPSIESHW